MLALLVLSLALSLHHSLAQVHADSDGFNLYKDLLRAKPDDGHAIFEHGENPAMYVYRSPSWLVLPTTDSSYNKRGVNHFKSFMLSPQREDELAQGFESPKQEEGIYHFPRVIVKRSALIDRVGKPCGWPDNAARLMAKKDQVTRWDDPGDRMNDSITLCRFGQNVADTYHTQPSKMMDDEK